MYLYTTGVTQPCGARSGRNPGKRKRDPRMREHLSRTGFDPTDACDG
jgi:hypothetical protein